MINAELLPAAVLQRKAVVYVRQSTQAQVQMNLESQRRQYDLVGEARRLGFRDIEVIDDDLARDFYIKYEFKPFATQPSRFFLLRRKST